MIAAIQPRDARQLEPSDWAGMTTKQPTGGRHARPTTRPALVVFLALVVWLALGTVEDVRGWFVDHALDAWVLPLIGPPLGW